MDLCVNVKHLFNYEALTLILVGLPNMWEKALVLDKQW